MFPAKFLECLGHEGLVAIATCSADNEVHLTNTWNSYVTVTEDDRLLIPAAGMQTTEENAKANPLVKITIGSHKVEGFTPGGTGFLLTGTMRFIDSGDEFAQINERFPFANRVLVFTPESCKQMQ